MTTAEAVRVAREVDALMENIDTKGLFKGQVTVTKYNIDTASFKVTISPNVGNHSEAEYVFEIVMECIGGPQINCQTAIYHPNIDITKNDGKLRIDLAPDLSAQDVVTKLLDLMHNPNFLKSHLKIDSSDSAQVAQFWDDTRTSIAGGRVGHYLFPVNEGYAKLHPPANDEGESTEVDGMELVDRNFEIKEYIRRSTPDDDDDDDDEGNDDDGDDDDDDDGGLYEKDSSEDDC